MGELFVIVISSMLVSNVVLSQFLGICPFLGVSKKVETAAGMGAAVTFVITIACIITYPVQKCILEPLGLEYLQTIAFILIIAALVQFVEMALKKFMPALYEALGVYLPLITTNCAVLGVAIKNISNGYGFIESVVCGFCTAFGFLISIVIMAGIRERIEVEPGFGGQTLIWETLEKVKQLHKIRKEQGLFFKIEIDGGVTKENARAVAACGVDIVVAGTAVFRGDIEENIHVLQEEINTEGQNAS